MPHANCRTSTPSSQHGHNGWSGCTFTLNPEVQICCHVGDSQFQFVVRREEPRLFVRSLRYSLAQSLHNCNSHFRPFSNCCGTLSVAFLCLSLLRSLPPYSLRPLSISLSISRASVSVLIFESVGSMCAPNASFSVMGDLDFRTA